MGVREVIACVSAKGEVIACVSAKDCARYQKAPTHSASVAGFYQKHSCDFCDERKKCGTVEIRFLHSDCHVPFHNNAAY